MIYKQAYVLIGHQLQLLRRLNHRGPVSCPEGRYFLVSSQRFQLMYQGRSMESVPYLWTVDWKVLEKWSVLAFGRTAYFSEESEHNFMIGL